MDIILDLLLIVLSLWWIALPILLVPTILSTVLFWRRRLYVAKKMDSVLLELKIPPDLLRSPAAMEQVLVSLHGLRNKPFNWRGYHWGGEIPRWSSLEIVSQGGSGSIRFFMRVPTDFRNIVEASLFSYYPEIEVGIADDYVSKLPSTVQDLENDGLDMWFAELTLAKDPIIPLRTYKEFNIGEEGGMDPLSSLVEVMGKIPEHAFAGIQIVISPAGKEWTVGGRDAIEQLRGLDKILTPGETTSISSIEANVSKPAFYVLARTLYIAPKEGFSSDFVGTAVANAFNQLSSPNHNKFANNFSTTPSFKKRGLKKILRGRGLWSYRNRSIPEDLKAGQVLTYGRFYNLINEKWTAINVEGLATLFHPLSSSVLTAPHLERLPSKRISAPAGLNIYGDEEAIKRFL